MARCKHLNSLGYQCNQKCASETNDSADVVRVFTKGIHMTTGYMARVERTDHKSGLCAFHMRMEKEISKRGGWKR